MYSCVHSRQERLDQFSVLCDIQPSRLLRPCQTRWLSLEAVVNRIVMMFDALVAFFASETPTAKTKEILKELRNPLTLCYYIFLSETLPLFTKFNLLFQVNYRYHVTSKRFVLVIIDSQYIGIIILLLSGNAYIQVVHIHKLLAFYIILIETCSKQLA